MVEQQEATAAAVTITQRSWGRGNREWTFRGADREAVQEAALAHYALLDEPHFVREAWRARDAAWDALIEAEEAAEVNAELSELAEAQEAAEWRQA